MKGKERSVKLNGRGCSGGFVEAEAVISESPFGFWQGIDPQTGIIIDQRHPLRGMSITGKVFIFPYGRGSTGTPGIFLEAVHNQVAPAAIINQKSEPMIIVCTLLAKEFYGIDIPLVDGFTWETLMTIQTGDRLRIDGASGSVEIIH
jgi:predicted aconitase with swiveling domain